MKATFVGICHFSGVSKRTGKDFTVHQAYMTSDFDEKKLKEGSVGQDVHKLLIPDRYRDIFIQENIGKEFDVELYYANGNEYIGYACPVAKR